MAVMAISSVPVWLSGRALRHRGLLGRHDDQRLMYIHAIQFRVDVA